MTITTTNDNNNTSSNSQYKITLMTLGGKKFVEQAPAAVSEACWAQAGLYVPKMIRHSTAMKYSDSYIQKLRRYSARFWSSLFLTFKRRGMRLMLNGRTSRFDRAWRLSEVLILTSHSPFSIRWDATWTSWRRNIPFCVSSPRKFHWLRNWRLRKLFSRAPILHLFVQPHLHMLPISTMKRSFITSAKSRWSSLSTSEGRERLLIEESNRMACGQRLLRPRRVRPKSLSR